MADFFTTGFAFFCAACALGTEDIADGIAADAVFFCADCGAPLTPAAAVLNPDGEGATPTYAELMDGVRATEAEHRARGVAI